MTLEVTELVGIVSLLYGMLLHSNVQSRNDITVPPELPQHTILVTTTGLRMLNHMATLDLSMLQVRYILLLGTVIIASVSVFVYLVSVT